MKKTGIIFLILIFMLQILPIAAHGQTDYDRQTLSEGKALAAEDAIGGTANSVILYERSSQTLLYARNPDEKINPTGLVKLLTALLVIEEGDLQDVVTVKRSTLNSIAPGAVSVGLKAGEELTLRDLLYCVMVASANDAAAVMAEHVAGSQAAFVEKMNIRAATLGCTNTHFTNVHGLKDERQYSTARDLAIVLDNALENPVFTELFAVTAYTVPTTNTSAARNLTTTNYMMDPGSKYFDSRVTGGKPAAATTADRSIICTAQVENAQYLCVVISAQARMSGGAVTRYTNFDEASDLLDMAFEDYAIQQVLGTEQPVGLVPVSGGENHVVVGPDREVFALLPVKFDASLLQFRNQYDALLLVAPLAAGAKIGTLQIFYGSVLIGQVDLQARHSVAPQGTTIAPVETDNGGSWLGKLLKWTGLVLLGLVALAVGVLLILRLVNLRRHRRRGNQAAQERGTG